MRQLGEADQLVHACGSRIQAHFTGQLDQCAELVRGVTGRCDGCFHLLCDQAESIVQKCGRRIDEFLIGKLAFCYNLLGRFGVSFPTRQQLEESTGAGGAPVAGRQPVQPPARGLPVKFRGGPDDGQVGPAQGERVPAPAEIGPIAGARAGAIDALADDAAQAEQERIRAVLADLFFLGLDPNLPDALQAPIAAQMADAADPDPLALQWLRRIGQLAQEALDRRGGLDLQNRIAGGLPEERGNPPRPVPLAGFQLPNGTQVVFIPLCCPTEVPLVKAERFAPRPIVPPRDPLFPIEEVL